MKIIIAMSGGVDSTVAAWKLKEQGHSVCGLFMKHPYQREDETAACAAAEFLRIPLKVIDFSNEFEHVVTNFTDVYLAGRTPNPCVLCNRTIKFGVVFDAAMTQLNGDGFATGHYAIRREIDGTSAIFCGADPTKDQSYVLYGIDPKKLSRIYFPLGEMMKVDVRKIAEKIGFPLRGQKESQDICFVEKGEHSAFLKQRCPDRITSGKFVDVSGKPLALHGGFERYTVGQRKGMGVGFGERIFVLKINADQNEVVIGSWDQLACKKFIATDVHWIHPEPEKLRPLLQKESPLKCGVKVRYRCNMANASVFEISDNAVSVTFDEPQYGIALGQSAVFYNGNRLLGGGIIDSTPIQNIDV
ncbi:MAG: tRNA 2-thiouridine(34) synthase MnmA [Thermoguttaceae bacterium]